MSLSGRSQRPLGGDRPRAMRRPETMSGSYHGPQRRRPYADQPEWLLLAYGHARAAGVPCGTVTEFCRRHLHLLPLGPKLTCTAVITTFMVPGNANNSGPA